MEKSLKLFPKWNFAKLNRLPPTAFSDRREPISERSEPFSEPQANQLGGEADLLVSAANQLGGEADLLVSAANLLARSAQLAERSEA